MFSFSSPMRWTLLGVRSGMNWQVIPSSLWVTQWTSVIHNTFSASSSLAMVQLLCVPLHNTVTSQGSHPDKTPCLEYRESDPSQWQWSPPNSPYHNTSPGAISMGVSCFMLSNFCFYGLLKKHFQGKHA